MRMDGIQIDMKCTLSIADAAAEIRLVSIVLLAQLRQRPMIAVAQQGSCCPVSVQRGIQTTIGGKRREAPSWSNTQRCRCPLQIIALRPGGLSRQHVRGTTQRLQRSQFAQTESGIHYQSHAHLHSIHTKVQLLKTTHLAQLQVITVVVVAQTVLIREERLAGILCRCQPELDTVVIVKLIADVVTVFIAPITCAIRHLVTLAAI